MCLLAQTKPLANALMVLIGLCVLVVAVSAILWGWSARRRAARNAERFSGHTDPHPGVYVDPWLLAGTRLGTPSADSLDRDRLNLEETRTPLHDHPTHPDGPDRQHPHDSHGHDPHGTHDPDTTGGGFGSSPDFGPDSGGGGGSDSGGGGGDGGGS